MVLLKPVVLREQVALQPHGAPAAGGAPTVGAHATGPWWQAAALGASFPVHPSPGSSEWYVSFPAYVGCFILSLMLLGQILWLANL